MAAVLTTVHVVRHGEVQNPTGVMYGRLPFFGLSERGLAMADRVADVLGERDVTVVRSSPLERAQQTAAPVAARLGLPVTLDGRLLEGGNHFEGLTFGVGDGSLRRPRHWPYLVNPLRPSWGEPYTAIAARMVAAVLAARARAEGHEAVLVSHQLPVWIARLSAEHRRLWHDPRSRECSLASVTSFRFRGNDLMAVDYTEPARDLLPTTSGRRMTAGA